MKFELDPLPYPKDALEPHIGRETLEFHYEKHHRGYLSKLEKAIKDKPEAEKSLEEIIRSADGSVFNNAAQVWNHTFYWNCMTPKNGGGAPKGEVAKAIDQSFGSYDGFREAFLDACGTLFGSGYVWLYAAGDGRLKLEKLKDADNPLVERGSPILTIDMWEHAYYLDYRNGKAKYAEAFVDHLVNWEFAEENLRGAR